MASTTLPVTASAIPATDIAQAINRVLRLVGQGIPEDMLNGAGAREEYAKAIKRLKKILDEKEEEIQRVIKDQEALAKVQNFKMLVEERECEAKERYQIEITKEPFKIAFLIKKIFGILSTQPEPQPEPQSEIQSPPKKKKKTFGTYGFAFIDNYNLKQLFNPELHSKGSEEWEVCTRIQAAILKIEKEDYNQKSNKDIFMQSYEVHGDNRLKTISKIASVAVMVISYALWLAVPVLALFGLQDIYYIFCFLGITASALFEYAGIKSNYKKIELYHLKENNPELLKVEEPKEEDDEEEAEDEEPNIECDETNGLQCEIQGFDRIEDSKIERPLPVSLQRFLDREDEIIPSIKIASRIIRSSLNWVRLILSCTVAMGSVASLGPCLFYLGMASSILAAAFSVGFAFFYLGKEVALRYKGTKDNNVEFGLRIASNAIGLIASALSILAFVLNPMTIGGMLGLGIGFIVCIHIRNFLHFLAEAEKEKVGNAKEKVLEIFWFLRPLFEKKSSNVVDQETKEHLNKPLIHL